MLPKPQEIPRYIRNNDPLGNEQFYYNDDKKAIYLKLHLDSKSTIERKATDKDKVQYKDAWEKFEKSRKKSLEFKKR